MKGPLRGVGENNDIWKYDIEWKKEDKMKRLKNIFDDCDKKLAKGAKKSDINFLGV